MANFISLIFSLLLLGLIIYWILNFIKPTQHTQIEKIQNILDKIYGPFLDVIRNKIKPIIKMRNGKVLDLSPGIFLIILAIARKLVLYIF